MYNLDNRLPSRIPRISYLREPIESIPSYLLYFHGRTVGLLSLLHLFVEFSLFTRGT